MSEPTPIEPGQTWRYGYEQPSVALRLGTEVVIRKVFTAVSTTWVLAEVKTKTGTHVMSQQEPSFRAAFVWQPKRLRKLKGGRS